MQWLFCQVSTKCKRMQLHLSKTDTILIDLLVIALYIINHWKKKRWGTVDRTLYRPNGTGSNSIISLQYFFLHYKLIYWMDIIKCEMRIKYYSWVTGIMVSSVTVYSELNQMIVCHLLCAIILTELQKCIPYCACTYLLFNCYWIVCVWSLFSAFH